jgi:hypothetical protein
MSREAKGRRTSVRASPFLVLEDAGLKVLFEGQPGDTILRWFVGPQVNESIQDSRVLKRDKTGVDELRISNREVAVQGVGPGFFETVKENLKGFTGGIVGECEFFAIHFQFLRENVAIGTHK